MPRNNADFHSGNSELIGYHVSPTSNRSGIERKGLLAKRQYGEGTFGMTGTDKGVYFTVGRSALSAYLNQNVHVQNSDVWEVRVSSSAAERDETYAGDDHDARFVENNIPKVNVARVGHLPAMSREVHWHPEEECPR